MINFQKTTTSQRLLFVGFSLQAVAIFLQTLGSIVASTEASELPMQPIKSNSAAEPIIRPMPSEPTTGYFSTQ